MGARVWFSSILLVSLLEWSLSQLSTVTDSPLDHDYDHTWTKSISSPVPLLVSSYVSLTSTNFDSHLSLGLLPEETNRTSKLADATFDSSNSSNSSLFSIFNWDSLLTLILPYSIIFVLAVVGNLLVIITLSMNRSMRSVTNIFLLNLAISDLLLGVFCMPFTLVGVLLRRFIFGPFVCHLISYLQAVSVAVSVWTLVAMSVERYYAICHPLRSRESRQTRQHAYRILALVWALALFLMSPTAIVSQLQLIPQTGNFKCREAWSSFAHKEAFTIFLDLCLLVVPLLIMIITYTSIAITLKQNLRHNPTFSKLQTNKNKKRTIKTTSFIEESDDGPVESLKVRQQPQLVRRSPYSSTSSTATSLSCKPTVIQGAESSRLGGCSLRDLFSSGSKLGRSTDTSGQTYNVTSSHSLRVNSSFCTIQARQRRVVMMLCVVVAEFFICWTPIFIVDTLALYQPALVYGRSSNLSHWIGIDIISMCHLLCFCSSCTNPVTYCFMNHRFRRHFCALFRCRKGHAANGGVPITAAFVSNMTNENESELNKENSVSFAFDSSTQPSRLPILASKHITSVNFC